MPKSEKVATSSEIYNYTLLLHQQTCSIVAPLTTLFKKTRTVTFNLISESSFQYSNTVTAIKNLRANFNEERNFNENNSNFLKNV
jgi:hypothetical protein